MKTSIKYSMQLILKYMTRTTSLSPTTVYRKMKESLLNLRRFKFNFSELHSESLLKLWPHHNIKIQVNKKPLLSRPILKHSRAFGLTAQEIEKICYFSAG